MSIDTNQATELDALPLRPMLEALSPAGRPSTACARCPAALWMSQVVPGSSTPKLKAWCRETHSYSWESVGVRIVDCDLTREQLAQTQQAG